jgi:hypothetical protein
MEAALVNNYTSLRCQHEPNVGRGFPWIRPSDFGERGLTNVAADKHFRMRLRRNGDTVLAAELRR